jgi:hypothetical protein
MYTLQEGPEGLSKRPLLKYAEFTPGTLGAGTCGWVTGVLGVKVTLGGTST